MPFCQVSRNDRARGRNYSCVVEHMMSGNQYFGCGLLNRSSFQMPDELNKYISTSGELKTREEQQVQRDIKGEGMGDC